MCGFDGMDPLDIASIIGLAESFMEGEREGLEGLDREQDEAEDEPDSFKENTDEKI